MKTLENQVIEKRALPSILNIDVVLSHLKNISRGINKCLVVLAGVFIMLMMLVVVINAVVRFFYIPFTGTTEIVGWLAAVAITFSLGYTHDKRGYVVIDLLTERFPSSIQKLLEIIILITCTIFFALVSWRMVLYGLSTAQNGNLSETMSIPFYPIIFIVGLGFASLTLSLFVDFLCTLRKIRTR